MAKGRGNGGRQPARGRRGGVRDRAATPIRAEPLAGGGERARPAVHRGRLSRRARLARAPPPRATGRGSAHAGAVSRRERRGRRERPAARSPPLARGVAPAAPHHAKRVHPARRPAVGTAGLHAAGGDRPPGRGRASPGHRDQGQARASLGHRRRGRRMSTGVAGVTDVAIVGGGPAGSICAMLLARLGHRVVLLERAPRWRWRACGVFASPAGVAALRGVGVTDAELARLARPLSVMRVQSAAGSTFGLTYGGSGALADSAVGFDRGALDPHLLALAAAAGVEVREGAAVERIRLEEPSPQSTLRLGSGEEVVARIVVGADGLRSTVARTAGVVRRARLAPRAALTFHVPDRERRNEARMIVIQDGYVGLAPVPGDRVNVGIVLGHSWFDLLRREGAWPVARRALARAMGRGDVRDGIGVDADADGGVGAGTDADLAGIEPLDRVAGVTPLGHAVARRAGDGWVLVGDAAGFLDPFTGEGLHRAIVSAERAADAIDATLAGRPGRGLTAYDLA